MSPHALRPFLLAVLLALAAPAAPAGMVPYTERGKTDFDTALELLKPYGTWSKIDGRWAFTPADHAVPYTRGRWLYCEYGWYWKGEPPHSWVTEHYGFWKRNAKTWSWYPGSYWLPEAVEFRATTGYVGWRSAEVNADGDFVEAPIDRYSKTDEWTFVTKAAFANPITPATLAPPGVAKEQLEESTDCRHSYLTYRELDRPGPHPADFLALCRDGGMYAPKTAADLAAAQAASSAQTLPGAHAPADGAGTDNDTRRVKYWITMSLPTLATPPPADAKFGELYLYHPDFYQDDDGIARRIAYWVDPKSRDSSKASLAELLGDKPAPGPAKIAAPAGAPATPAIPAVPEKPQDPFRSPFDDSFHGGAASKTSSKAPPPSGAVTPSATPETNAAP